MFLGPFKKSPEAHKHLCPFASIIIPRIEVDVLHPLQRYLKLYCFKVAHQYEIAAARLQTLSPGNPPPSENQIVSEKIRGALYAAIGHEEVGFACS
jgi:hypothetical protein